MEVKDYNQFGGAQLCKVLCVMFPASYIKSYHQSPGTVCSLLSTRCWQQSTHHEHQCEISTEPSSRSNVVSLREHFDASLAEHQAKPVGLCPIRRAIYDQCFDELIRQVTIGCIEQGLLLFRVRNELRMTIECYRKAYESGVKYGFNKAIEAELELQDNRTQIIQLNQSLDDMNKNREQRDRASELELRNKLHSYDTMREFYESELTKKDQIIEQQRAIIRALSHKSAADIKSPIQ